MKKVLAFVLFIGMAGHAYAIEYNAGSPGSFSYGGLNWDTSFTSYEFEIDPVTGFPAIDPVTGDPIIKIDPVTGDPILSINPAGDPNHDGFIGTGVDAGVGDVQLVSSDTGIISSTASIMTTTIGAGGGSISFDWDYFTFDPPALLDPFVWLLDGVEQAVTGFDLFGGFGQQTGSFLAEDLEAGSIFSLAILSDNLFGQPPGAWSADVGLSAFTFTAGTGGNPSAVPVPPAFLLFGTALAGLGFFRKKKAAA